MAVTGSLTNIIEFTAAADAVTGLKLLVSIRWSGATTAGHQCVVSDSAGNVVFRSEANGANFIDGWVFDRKTVDGLVITTLGSGTVTAYFTGS